MANALACDDLANREVLFSHAEGKVRDDHDENRCDQSGNDRAEGVYRKVLHSGEVGVILSNANYRLVSATNRRDIPLWVN